MKRFSKSMRGVTLLEILLVLAVAAMIIVMSVRYYQSATSNQQVNATMDQIQAITANADSIAQGNNSYSTVTTAAIQPMMPQSKMKTVWGGNITVAPGGGTSKTTSYTVTIPEVPVNVCSQIISKLAANSKFTVTQPGKTADSCGTTGKTQVVYIYESK